MALQGSGAITLLDIQNEFGGSAPISIDEYYGRAAGVPQSGEIGFDDFYGTTAIVALTNSFNTGRAANTFYEVGDTFTFPGSGAASYSFNVYNLAEVDITMHGAKGGGFGTTTGDNGSIVVARFDLSPLANTQSMVYTPGFAGTDSPNQIDAGGFYPGGNIGGGTGYGRGGGGGGRSAILIGGAPQNELVVAAGGGGGFGTLNATSNRVNGQNAPTFPYSQPQSWFEGGPVQRPNDGAGGGGGYFGGFSAPPSYGAGNASNGGAGTNFINSTYEVSTTTNQNVRARTGGASIGYLKMTVVSLKA